jgi:hypothetical protein
MTSAQAVSKLVATTGISRSTEARGRVSSVCNEGFVVRKDNDGNIIVDYTKASSSMRWSEASYASYAKREKDAFAKMYDVLVANGYWIEFAQSGAFIVTKETA